MENEVIDQTPPQPAALQPAAPASGTPPASGTTTDPAPAGSTEPPAGTPAEPTRTDPPQWAVRRIGELTAARKAAEERATAQEAEAAQLRQQIEQFRQTAEADPDVTNATGTPPVVHPNVQQLAQALAQDMTREQVRQLSVSQRAQSVEEAGRKEFGDDFDRSVQNLAMAGATSPEFIEAATSIPNAEKVVRFLGADENIDEAIRISKLPPLQMGIELMRLAPKAVQAYAKPVSSAPAPITPIDGNGRAEGGEPDPKDTRAWMEHRNKTARRRYR